MMLDWNGYREQLLQGIAGLGRPSPGTVRGYRELSQAGGQTARLDAKTREAGRTLVPLSLYFRNGRAKVEIALARGKREYDKRHDIAEREAKREMERALRRRR